MARESKSKTGTGNGSIRYKIGFILISSLLLTINAISTNNRILLGTLLSGSALVTSLYGDYNFSEFELALLTTAALILTFPRTSQSNAAVQPSCTTPGYTEDPLLGCYRIYDPRDNIAHGDAAKLCASDGGQLLIINSEAEFKAVVTKMLKTRAYYTFIQGNKANPDEPWLDDRGNPLPYLPTAITNDNSVGYTRLTIVPSLFLAVKNTNPFNEISVACEI